MYAKHKPTLVLIAYAAAAFFFLFAVCDWSIGDLNLIAAGLLSLAAGFLLERAP